jgi:hypothetical protein
MVLQGVLAEINSRPAPCPSSVYMTRHGSSLISVEDSAPSQGPVASDFVTGRFGRSSLEHDRRQFERRQGNLVRISLEEFDSPNRSLDCKIQIPELLDFNAGICYFLTPFLLTG